MSERFQYDAWIDSLAAKFPSDSILKSPSFPDMLNQPDLVIVPKPGQIIALFAYFPERTGRLRPTYQAIEDIFEAKLAIGEKTTVGGLILDGFAGERGHRPNEINAVLKSVFDIFWEWPKTQPAQLADEISPSLIRSIPKESTIPLWKAERLFVTEALRSFKREAYVNLIEDPSETDLRPEELHSSIRRLLFDEFGTDLIQGYKPHLFARAGSVPWHTSNEFDFALRSQERPIEVVQIRRPNVRQRVRDLMAKARLLRYSGTTMQTEWPPRSRPLLIVDGNLAGPSGDKYRYIRGLISVGWEIVGVSQVLQNLEAKGS